MLGNLRWAALLPVVVACTEPVEPEPDVSFIAISVNYDSCGLAHDGGLYCWGESELIPTPKPYPGSRYVRISAGSGHVCGLTDAGVLSCGGANGSGQLGDNTTLDRAAPVAVAIPGARSVAAVATGTYHTCAVATDGTAWCWGKNATGQLGDGTTSDRYLPVPVAAPGQVFDAIAANEYHTCALTVDGQAWCWGLNDTGQLGIGLATHTEPVPVPVSMPGLAFATIALGISHTCGLTDAGNVWCWGFNHRGRLGDGTTINRSFPVLALNTDQVPYSAITAGRDHTCALTSLGSAYCWGRGALGATGLGHTEDKHRPTAVVMPSGTTFTGLSGGFAHTCAVDNRGGAWCWGWNDAGRLGDGTTIDRLVPTRVAEAAR